MEKDSATLIKAIYAALPGKVAEVRAKFGRPITLTEKILFSHMAKPLVEVPVRGKTFLFLRPDRVAMQDATAQMALLQFMQSKRDSVAVPTTIHCDHLIQAYSGAKSDLLRAFDENREVYDFLESAAQRYNIGFWKAGAGIIHQVVLENYAFPGGIMIGTDSHTPNAGGLGMIAVGVGGADACEVMAGEPWGVMNPKLVGVHLKGKLSGWASAKDVILKVAGALTVQGGTGKIVEYFGEGTASISCTGKATVTNMGAELGATTSLFPYDVRMADYLKRTERQEIAAAADQVAEHLRADPEVLKDPAKYYDEVLEIDLSKLEPQWVGPHTPDRLKKVSEMKQDVKDSNFPEDIKVALIGSCTNSSYEDISRSASIARQAKEHGLKAKVNFLVTPGSDQIYKTIQRDGLLEVFESVGGTVLANACGPCIGQWKRDDIKQGERNVIVTSYNRNFARRNDDNPETLAFIGSPELVTAVVFSGKLSFDPARDEISTNGKSFKFKEPVGDEYPKNGFVFAREGLVAPDSSLEQRKKVNVKISKESVRLEFLPDFAAWDGKDWSDMLILLKAKGKCTTDHISPAGKWLTYRGHLTKISDNMFTGANNAFTSKAGTGVNILSGQKEIPLHEIAKAYKAKGQAWVAIGDENYGEGSSREHAAMSPRFLGCKAVITKSFARIHETNLKKQGILPLTFVDPKSWDDIEAEDRVSLVGMKDIKPASPITLVLKGPKGERKHQLKHTMLDDQIAWFRAGCMLNTLRPT